MLHITATISIDPSELEEVFVRASGPGGQNVNKVSTAVQLRFDVRRSPSLPEPVRQRLIKLAGKRMTADGVLVITADRHRSQARNRQDAPRSAGRSHPPGRDPARSRGAPPSLPSARSRSAARPSSGDLDVKALRQVRDWDA